MPSMLVATAVRKIVQYVTAHAVSRGDARPA